MQALENGQAYTIRYLEEKMRAHGVLLFGAGFVAQSFYKVLRNKNLDDLVEGCIVSGAGGDSFFGKPVYSLSALPADVAREHVICVCVHETLKDEVLGLLRNVQSAGTFWIYPFLFPMAFGAPVREGYISANALLSAQPKENHWISVRFMALEDHIAGRTDGYGIRVYKKTQGLFSGQRTADQRMQRFFVLYHAMANEGYRPECSVLIDEDLRVIDGLHRIAAAVMLGVRQIPYCMVQKNGIYEELFSEGNRITPAAQEKASLSQEEKKRLQTAKQVLLKRAGKGEER